METTAPEFITKFGAISRLTTSFNAENTLSSANHETCSRENLCRNLEQVIPKDTSSSPPTNFPPKHLLSSQDNINPHSSTSGLQILIDLSPASPPSYPSKKTIHNSHGEQPLLPRPTHARLTPTPPPIPVSPTYPQNQMTLLVILLTIPVRIPPPLQCDTDSNPSLMDIRLHHLLNLSIYQAYQDNPSHEIGIITLVWLNLLRGLLNNSSWAPAWSHLMNIVLVETQPTERSRTIMNFLRSQAILMLPPPRIINQTHPYTWLSS